MIGYVVFPMSNRIRRHVDPFQCRIALTPEDWQEAYRAGGLGDIWLDLGCGKGELLATLAATHPAVFFIGIEVRRKIADKYFPRYGHIRNLLLLHGNVSLSIPPMMGTRKVQRVLINFPDPCDYKPRYMKRQMVNKRLVEGICDILAPGGVVSIKTDRRNLFEEMDLLFLSRLHPFTGETYAGSEQSFLSEWESDCMKKSVPILSRDYRFETRSV